MSLNLDFDKYIYLACCSGSLNLNFKKLVPGPSWSTKVWSPWVQCGAFLSWHITTFLYLLNVRFISFFHIKFQFQKHAAHALKYKSAMRQCMYWTMMEALMLTGENNPSSQSDIMFLIYYLFSPLAWMSSENYCIPP